MLRINLIKSCYPESDHQKCVVHQIRNSVKHVSYKDLKAVCADLKTIYAYERKLTAYDAAYLLLAKKQCCPLATFDKDLIYAAEQEEVRVISLE